MGQEGAILNKQVHIGSQGNPSADNCTFLKVRVLCLFQKYYGSFVLVSYKEGYKGLKVKPGYKN